MSNPAKSRRSWSLPPKLMKSRKLVSTYGRSNVDDWERVSHVEHTHCGMWMGHRVAAQLLPPTAAARATTVQYYYHSTCAPASWSARSSHTNSSRPRSRSRGTELRARAGRAGGFGLIGGSGTGGARTAAAWPVATAR
eukprot:scaffold45156_cov63-Phaeocystis_antarctica.AAC.5